MGGPGSGRVAMAKLNSDVPQHPRDSGGDERLVLREPKQIQAYLLDHPLSKGGKRWCDRLLEGVDEGERWAMLLFGRVMKWVGAEVEINNVLVQHLGDGATPEKAQMAWNAYRRVQQVAGNEDAIAAQLHQHLEDYYRARGQRLVVLSDSDEVRGTP